MELRHLRYFVAVGQELNLGRAATRLHISQPPLTRQIQQLEEEMHAELFVRTPKGVELTQAGEVLMEEAQKILTLSDRAVERTQKAGHGELGHIDVGIYGSAILTLIPKLLLDFRTQFSGIHIGLHTMLKAAQIAALRERRLSIGFNRMFPDTPDMQVELILQEPLMVATTSGNALAKRREIHVRELAGHPMILYPNIPPPSHADAILTFCRNEGFLPDVVQQVNDVTTALALVSGGFGITVVPQSAMNLRLPRVVFRPFKSPAPMIDLSCMYRKDDTSPILASFLKTIRNYKKQ